MTHTWPHSPRTDGRRAGARRAGALFMAAISAAASAAVLLTAAPGPANAAPAAFAESASALAVPIRVSSRLPSCVTAWERAGLVTRTGYVKSACRGTYKVKFYWVGVPDSGCRTLSPGETESHKVNKFQARGALIDRC
ncbi:hypothetical protein [Nonomuraea sp. NPDC050643]|uniref:hypothetical protein n=1 Tax=Nonomuraea sp. NPDC050643 TaxID=3155660 RepID=UPI0033CEF040